MNKGMRLLVYQVPAILLIYLTSYMILADIKGWGWVLASSLIACFMGYVYNED